MAVNTETMAEYMASQEPPIIGWYTWRPNQLYTRDPDHPDSYTSTDVITDGTINEILESAQDAADRQILAINQAGASKTTEINNQNTAYAQIKAICLQTFRSLRSSLTSDGYGTAAAILNAAIQNINNLP